MDWFNTMLLCLAINTYHEARFEPLVGQVAVTQVVVNRAKANHQDLCEVVFRSKQFSWTEGALDSRGVLKPEYIPKKNDPLWIQDQKIAREVLNNKWVDLTGGAKYYHALYVAPRWATHLEHTTTIGLHKFYREYRRKKKK